MTVTTQLRTFLKSHFPHLVAGLRYAKYFSLSRKPPKDVFTEIFNQNKWRDRDSRSGEGSNLIQTAAIRRALPLLIQELNCRSLLDVPCGDFFWMKSVETNVDYIGGDIVSELIERNQERYGDNAHRFVTLDLLQDALPRVDLVFCRDCLVHLSYQDIFRALKNLKTSGSAYLLTTTFIGRERNDDIPTGSWRPINLQLAPFGLPAPMKLIDEECPVDGYRDKHLGLWRLNDIPDYRSVR